MTSESTIHTDQRISSIDIVRGLVMVIMVLDHTRDLIHVDSLAHDPTDLKTTTGILFFTRWITHLCAPTFVFLSGLSAYLSVKKEQDLKKSRDFLIKRGLWLILLEFTLINFGIWFDIHFQVFLLQVIAAIGLGFIFTGLLLKADPKVLGLMGLFIVATHNLFPLIPLDQFPHLKAWLSPLFQPGLIPLPWGANLLIGYPPLPWMAILFIGFAFGKYLPTSVPKRKSLFLFSGLLCIALFLILRLSNVYGDPAPWTVQKDSWFTFLSFINITKYPPSLLFDSLMLGIMFIGLFIAEQTKGILSNILNVYGRVPLFYYLIHWYIVHPILFAILFLQGFAVKDFQFGFNFGRPNAECGLPLWGVYLVWLMVVALLFPLCSAYSQYKLKWQKERKWLRYL